MSQMNPHDDMHHPQHKPQEIEGALDLSSFTAHLNNATKTSDHLSLDTVPLEIQQRLDLIIAERFVEHGAERLALALASYLQPVQAVGWENIIRSKMPDRARELRTTTHEALKDLDVLCEMISDSLTVGDLDDISNLVKTELAHFLERSNSLANTLRDHNLEVYNCAYNDTLNAVKRFLKATQQSHKLTDPQLDQMVQQRLTVTRNDYVDLPYNYINDVIAAYQTTHLPEHADLNREVLQLIGTDSVDGIFNEQCPLTLAHSTYIRYILVSLMARGSDLLTALQDHGMEMLNTQNMFFEAVTEPMYPDSIAADLLHNFITSDDIFHVTVGNTGEITFELKVPRVLHDVAVAQCADLFENTDILQTALSLSGSTLRVDYSPDSELLTLALAFRVTLDPTDSSYRECTSRIAKFKESYEEAVSVRRFQFERTAQIGDHQRQYSITFPPSLLDTSELRAQFCEVVGRTDKFIVCLPRFNQVYIEFEEEDSSPFAPEEFIENSRELKIYLRGQSEETQETITTKASKFHFADLLEGSYGWDSNRVQGWSSSPLAPLMKDTVLQYTFDAPSLLSPEIGDLVADLEKRADVMLCSLTSELYKRSVELPEESDPHQLMIASLESLNGLIDLLQPRYPKERFRIFVPAGVRRTVFEGNDSPIQFSMDKTIFYLSVRTQNDVAIASGYFNAAEQQFYFCDRSPELEEAFLEAVLDGITRIEPADPERGAARNSEISRLRITKKPSSSWSTFNLGSS